MDARENVVVSAAARDTALTLYRIWRFDAKGAQTEEVECVLRKGEAANVFARDYFASRSGTAQPTSPMIFLNIGVGTTCFWAGDQGDVECGGVMCYLMGVSMRAGYTRVAPPPGASEGVTGASGGIYAVWDCVDGGMLSLSGGTVTYHYPDGSGGGGGGGGTGPNNPCYNPTPGDTNDDGTPYQDAIRWGYTCEVDPPAGMQCIPVPGNLIDTSCYSPLTASDTLVIRLVLDSLLVDPNSITDTAARSACVAGATAIRDTYASGMLFRARYDTPMGTDTSHSGATDSTTGRVHIEAYHLADAKLTGPVAEQFNYKAELALTLIHERLHVTNRPRHLTGEPYMSHPWSYFHSIQHEQSNSSVSRSPCVHWN